MLVRTILILSLLCSSCAVKLPEIPRADLDTLYIASGHDNELLTRNAPIFLVRDYTSVISTGSAPPPPGVLAPVMMTSTSTPKSRCSIQWSRNFR